MPDVPGHARPCTRLLRPLLLVLLQWGGGALASAAAGPDRHPPSPTPCGGLARGGWSGDRHGGGGVDRMPALPARAARAAPGCALGLAVPWLRRGADPARGRSLPGDGARAGARAPATGLRNGVAHAWAALRRLGQGLPDAPGAENDGEASGVTVDVGGAAMPCTRDDATASPSTGVDASARRQASTPAPATVSLTIAVDPSALPTTCGLTAPQDRRGSSPPAESTLLLTLVDAQRMRWQLPIPASGHVALTAAAAAMLVHTPWQAAVVSDPSAPTHRFHVRVQVVPHGLAIHGLYAFEGRPISRRILASLPRRLGRVQVGMTDRELRQALGLDRVPHLIVSSGSNGSSTVIYHLDPDDALQVRMQQRRVSGPPMLVRYAAVAVDGAASLVP